MKRSAKKLMKKVKEKIKIASILHYKWFDSFN